MVVVVRNPMYRLIALGVSIAIFLIIYFAVIKPDQNTANNQIKAGEQQIQQAVSQANQSSGGAVPAGVTSLTSCIAAAGTNMSQIQACDAKYKP